MATAPIRAKKVAKPARSRSAVSPPAEVAADPGNSLGARLKEVRLRSGMSLRAVARALGVSPSFVSQLEKDRSRPSVATLYSLAQLLNVTMDELFDPSHVAPDPTDPAHADPSVKRISRSDLGTPADAWDSTTTPARLSVTNPGTRARLVMDSGVVWEQLASSVGHGVDFMEIVYEPGACSTNDGRMLRHSGFECGYLVEGELEVTVGFETTTMRRGDAIGFDSSVPHLLRNRGKAPARGIWCVFQ